MAEKDDFGGRKPSYNFTRNGPVMRGLRSKPGATEYDPSTANPGTVRGLTPKSNWDSAFANSQFGKMNPLSPEARAAAPSAQSFRQVDYETQGFDGGDTSVTAPKTPDLETMASGGMNHAQRWSNPGSVPALRSPDRSWSADPFMPRPLTDKFIVDDQGGFFASKPDRNGFTATSNREARSIQDKYKSPFGWSSAFKRTA